MTRMLSDPKCERNTYWRMVIGWNHWGIVLLTHGRKGEPKPKVAEPIRLNPRWQQRLDEQQGAVKE